MMPTKPNTKNISWEQVKQFELDNPTSPLSFTNRLARDNGWTLEFSIRAVEEYKKFIYLNCIATHQLTPSDEVDQVWHLHLLYTESYWIDMCQHLLERNIHHGPTKGGSSEQNKFTDYYQKTLDLYKEVFKTTPPFDLWPPSPIRFANVVFQRVNLKTNWVIKKPTLFLKQKT